MTHNYIQVWTYFSSPVPVRYCRGFEHCWEEETHPNFHSAGIKITLNCGPSKFTRPGEHLAPKAPPLLQITFAQSGKFKTGRGTYTFCLQEVLIRVGQTENQMKEIFNPHSLCHYKPNRQVSTSQRGPFFETPQMSFFFHSSNSTEKNI